MQVIVHCPGRFLDVIELARKQDCLDALFETIRDIEDICKESCLQSPRCNLYEDDSSHGFAFSIEMERAGTPKLEMWRTGRIRYLRDRNRWVVAA